MTSRSYAILGTGAIGGYYGGALARHGHDVHFLLRSDAPHVKQHGLRVDSPHGDFTLPRVHAHTDVRDMPRCDVAIVALKSTHNHLLAELLPPVLKDRGAVVMLQNGLGGDGQAAAIAGPDRVLGGLCFVCIHKIGPGHIRHLDYGLVTLGRHTADGLPGGVDDLMRDIADDFAPTGIPFQCIDDLVLARWKKLVWNVPYNGLCIVADTTTDVLMKTPRHLKRITALMREVQAACLAVTGRAITDAHLEQMLENTRKMTPYKPSMTLDHEAGRPMEIDAIVGLPLRQAQAAGCPAPHLHRLYDALRAVEAGYHRG